MCGLLPFPIVTWLFPQVLLNGVNPLIALNQFVNSEMFIVFYHLFPQWLFFNWSEEQTLIPHVVENVPSSSWDCFSLTEPVGLYQHQWRLCHYLTPVCSWKWTNGEKTFIIWKSKHLRGRTGPRETGTDSRLVKDGVWRFGGLLVCHQVSCSHLWLWLYWLGCRCSLATGADTAGQLNADRRSSWRWEGGVSSVRAPPLLDTEIEAWGEFLLLGWRVKRKFFGGASPPFHLDAVFTSCLPFIVEFSNIINIEI